MQKILIIDDDKSILDALTLVLEDAGYQVNTVGKGSDAIGYVTTFNPDIILLDMLLSGSDGRHICQQLKNDKATKTIPIIIFSAHPTAEKSAIEAGADEFLAKPFDTDQLFNKLNLYTS